MISFREMLTFLTPAFMGAAVAVIVFQIIDRLKLFYQTNAKKHEASDTRAVA